MRTLGGTPSSEDNRIRLEFILRARSELAAAPDDMLRLLAPNSLADTLGDPDRIAAYAECLAAEAVVREAAGQIDRAQVIRERAVALAREAQRRSPAPDADIDSLIAHDGRFDHA